MNEPRFTTRDAFGLTENDWNSLLNPGTQYYSGPAMLFWALAGSVGDKGVYAMILSPLPHLLGSIALDVRAMATLAKSSRAEAVKALAPALDNLCRRIEAAAEISLRKQEIEADDSEP